MENIQDKSIDLAKDKFKSFEEELQKVREEKLNFNDLKTLEYIQPKVMRYALYKHRTKFEILKKFEKEFEEIDNNQIEDEIFKYLEENQIIDDEVYALNYLKDAINFRRNSIFELKMKLKEKGVDSLYIEEAVYQLEDELNSYEYKTILSILKQRRRQEKEKTVSYLYRKGFKSFNIKNAIEDFEEES